MEVQVDINIRSPKGFSREQALPSREPDFYVDHLKYAIVDEDIDLKRAGDILHKFCKESKKYPGRNIIRDIVVTGQYVKVENVQEMTDE